MLPGKLEAWHETILQTGCTQVHKSGAEIFCLPEG